MKDAFRLEDRDEHGWRLHIRGEWECEDLDGATVAVDLSLLEAVDLMEALEPVLRWWREDGAMIQAARASARSAPSREQLEEIAAPGSGFPLHEQISARQELDR